MTSLLRRIISSINHLSLSCGRTHANLMVHNIDVLHPVTVLGFHIWDQGLEKAGSREGVSWPLAPKIWSWGEKLHMELMSDRCQSNGNDHLSDLNACIHISGRFVKRTMGTLASQAEIGVLVQAPGTLLRGSRGITPEKFWDCICKILQSRAFLTENGSQCCP